MQKDVIYIDVEDDITAIIGKIKDASHKVVALVPPKRTGAIQSAVNLKLVQRAAEQSGKRLVLITNNQALMALANAASIPVSKNLQSKPELAEIPAIEIDEGDDVIDGAELPVGDHMAMSDKSVDDTLAPSVGEAAIAAADDKTPSLSARKAAAATAAGANGKSRIPNFDTFRKKLFVGIGAGVLLIGFFVWAIMFAPSARIIVTAKTTDSSLNSRVTLKDATTTSLKDGLLASTTKTVKKPVSIAFTATGKKDVGEKATGNVSYSNGDFTSVTVPAGTTLTSKNSGLKYITTSSVTVPAGGCSSVFNCKEGKASGTVVAADSGPNYNGDSGALSGASVSATFSGATSGGTSKIVTVVTQQDFDTASGDVTKNTSGDAAKADLKKQFGSDYIVLDATFKSDASAVKPVPAIDAEAPDGKATLAGDVAYSIVALKKTEITKYLDSYFAQQIDGQSDQKVYSNGLNDVAFNNVAPIEGGYSASISTNGKIGPKIDENELKQYSKGKRYGEIQSRVTEINGVENVDVKFSPFWVNSAPNDVNRIKVEFKVNGS
jgi:hypothetical protein